MTTDNINNDLFRNRYRIPTSRAGWHDYNHGIYYVTICTANRMYYFGDIMDGKMVLSEMGMAVIENFRNIAVHYPYAEIPLFVVMPNHIHAVVVIDGNKYNHLLTPVETMCTSSLQLQQKRWKTDIVNEEMRRISHKRGTLSFVIGGLKRAITHYAHINGIDFAWQPRFHDRIVRNMDELNRIAEYIKNNVANWQTDELKEI